MASSKIVLFDIPSKEPNHAWSLNTWKTRLVLNYKGLDYETEWLEYPEIKPRLEPHIPGKDQYTVPTVIMPDGTYIMDSKVIVGVLEEKYPSPPLPINWPHVQRYIEELKGVFENLRPIFMPAVRDRLLKDLNREYWNRTRSGHVGMDLDQFVKEHSAEEAYKGAATYLKNTISYVDFTHAGFLLMFRQFGDDIFQPVLEGTGDPELHLKFLEALKPWTERDNY
ncbi:putative glutathione S-transferase [Xylaria bambusicola]|uniref:putative glutathione S-transferase n=1 Tax=Xylaria bambusicola TaxID=326684 RepID=UPI002008C5EE|nr:putative glutathione S-transferase [Xylaria bambusicola]KAI0509129.1 putative glutathione S-transferase [Xylaria bambusicola]